MVIFSFIFIYILLIQDLMCFCTAIDLKSAQGALHKGPYNGKADVTFTVADEDFIDVVLGKLNPQKVQLCHIFCEKLRLIHQMCECEE